MEIMMHVFEVFLGGLLGITIFPILFIVGFILAIIFLLMLVGILALFLMMLSAIAYRMDRAVRAVKRFFRGK